MLNDVLNFNVCRIFKFIKFFDYIYQKDIFSLIFYTFSALIFLNNYINLYLVKEEIKRTIIHL